MPALSVSIENQILSLSLPKGRLLQVIIKNKILPLRPSLFLVGGTINLPALRPSICWKHTVTNARGPLLVVILGSRVYFSRV